MSDSEVVWNIRYTETAKNDLKGIVSYIKNVLLEEMIAQNMYSAITSAIRSIDTMPFRHQLYRDEPWFSQGLRMMKVKTHLVHCLTDEGQKEVRIVRIMYAKRDIRKHLSDLE